MRLDIKRDMRFLTKRLVILLVAALLLIGLAALRSAFEPGLAPWAGDLLLTAGIALAAGCGWAPGLVGLALASLVLTGDLSFSSSGVLAEILEKLVLVVAVVVASGGIERYQRLVGKSRALVA